MWKECLFLSIWNSESHGGVARLKGCDGGGMDTFWISEFKTGTWIPDLLTQRIVELKCYHHKHHLPYPVYGLQAAAICPFALCWHIHVSKLQLDLVPCAKRWMNSLRGGSTIPEIVNCVTICLKSSTSCDGETAQAKKSVPILAAEWTNLVFVFQRYNIGWRVERCGNGTAAGGERTTSVGSGCGILELVRAVRWYNYFLGMWNCWLGR